MDRLDRVRGMFMGVFLGDALGAPFEWPTSKNVPYNGVLDKPTVYNSRWQGKKELQPGQYTDDSEMTITLMRSLARLSRYDNDDVLQNYLNWANSGTWCIGKNTAALLKGVTTIKGYQNRIASVLSAPIELRSQSNGSLMRISPMALLPLGQVTDQNIINNTSITNPCPINIEINIIYVHMLQVALQGATPEQIWQEGYRCVTLPELRAIFESVSRDEKRDVVKNRAWVQHAFWMTLTILKRSACHFTDCLTWVIDGNRGSDTDTNAAISMALLGAIKGYQNISQDSTTAWNINKILTLDLRYGQLERPKCCEIDDFFQITEHLCNVFQ